jgi:hypothetical protein
MTSDNHRLDRTEITQIFTDGERKAVELEARMQALVNKLLAMRAEIEDGHTGSVTLHLGEERGNRVRVKARVEKVY